MLFFFCISGVFLTSLASKEHGYKKLQCLPLPSHGCISPCHVPCCRASLNQPACPSSRSIPTTYFAYNSSLVSRPSHQSIVPRANVTRQRERWPTGRICFHVGGMSWGIRQRRREEEEMYGMRLPACDLAGTGNGGTTTTSDKQ